VSKTPTPSKIFASNLKRLRSQANLTQEMAAEKSNLHWRYLQRLESGKANPSLEILHRVKHGLACRWDDLLGR